MASWGISKLTVRPTLAALLRYGLAAFLVAIALAIAVITHLHHSPPRFVSHFVLLAIAITFWCAGTGPGLLALLLSCLGVAVLARTHFLTPDFPLGSFLVFFVVFSLLLSLFTASRRRALQELRKARDELEIKVAERTAQLTRRERELRDLLDSIPATVWSTQPDGSNTYVNKRFEEYSGSSPEQMAGSGWQALIHPDDLERHAAKWMEAVATGKPLESEVRSRRSDGQYRWQLDRGVPLRDEDGKIVKWYGVTTDIEDRKRAEEALRTNEAYLAEAQRLSHTGTFGWKPDSGEIVWTDETYRVFEYDRAEKPTLNMVEQRVHPNDRALVQQVIERASQTGIDFEHEYRLLMPDGRVKHVHALAHVVQDASGVREFVGAVTDITERKRAEEKIREQESELRQMLDFTPQLIAVYGSNSERLYANRGALDYLGMSLDDWRQRSFGAEIHPDDLKPVRSFWEHPSSNGSAHELEVRLRKGDGSFRWFLIRFNPLHDEKGQIKRWYIACTDIDDRKRAEERLQQENVALREEIDQTSMFEEIVGTSPALQTVLSRISKVAPSDSTVLITGETGTGKELVARAIHRRSQRSGRAFISVNCAAIPRDLIPSELFGHEKGAFTGAIQRRLGRFELADGGTIFLDEVGELSPETQVALLRVLQEREFERVGGGQPIHLDVRVIAATNRDLHVAVANGSFRQDLFYRLNVFPVDVPALRERKDDILMLVKYFAQRYASRAGKNIHSIDKNTLDLLQSYHWPGNIRELQNVIERSVILSSGEALSVDELWLSKEPSPPPSRAEASPRLNGDAAPRSEQAIIEAALAESRGRVYGPSGAAAKLGISTSTLDRRIKALKIYKDRFKLR